MNFLIGLGCAIGGFVIGAILGAACMVIDQNKKK